MTPVCDFKIIAGKNPAKELEALNEELKGCCCVVHGKNGETMFDAFDIFQWAAERFESIARKYAEMENPGEDDGISYIRKGVEPGDEIVEYTNRMTECNVCVVLDVPEFEAI